MRYNITNRPHRMAALAIALLLAACAASPAARPPAAEASATAAPAAAAQSALEETALAALRGTGGAIAIGTASYYGIRHHGRRTASGEPFDRLGMTAAHPRLPLGTHVRVTNLATGRAVVVRINDRCRCPGKVIDLSEGAARAIGMQASAPVRMERL
jgi:rare lipoprotein A